MSDAAPTDPIEAWWKVWNLRINIILKVVSLLSIIVALVVAWQQADDYQRHKSLLDLRIETE